MNPLRMAGWMVVVVLAAASWAAGWFSPRVAKPPPDPPAQELAAVARMSPDQQAAWLRRHQRRYGGKGGAAQLLIVRAVAGQPPVVVCAPDGEEDDEITDDWEPPWPAVQKALASPPSEPVKVRGRYQGFHYEHRLLPLGQGRHGLYLLVNRWHRPKPWLGWRLAALIAAVGLGGYLVVTRPQ